MNSIRFGVGTLLFILTSSVLVACSGAGTFSQEEARNRIRQISGATQIECESDSCSTIFPTGTSSLKKVMNNISNIADSWVSKDVELENGRRYTLLEHEDSDYRYRVTVGANSSSLALYRP